MGNTKLTTRGTKIEALSDKHRRFVERYLVDFNGAAAARAAGYRNPEVMAARLLKHKKIASVIGRCQHQAAHAFAISRERVLEEVAYTAFRDPLDLCDENGMIVVDDLRKIPERMRRCIDGIKVKQFTNPETGETTTVAELKLGVKLDALKLLMQHLGIVAPKEVEVTHTLNWEDYYEKVKMTSPRVVPAEYKHIGLD